MKYRKLGKTGLDASIIGLGTEYLNEVPRETVVSVVREATDRGVNYIDLFFAHPEIRDNIGAALEGRRDKVMIAGHLGAAAKEDGQYYKTRDREISEKFFLDLLPRLRTDYIDVLMLHFVDSDEEYEEVFNGTPLELAHRFQQEGKARLIGMSGHNPSVALRAIRAGQIDVLMYPINPTESAESERKELLNVCVSEGVGLVAMKPYAGGKLLQKKASASITPVQCISYTLSQIGVSTTVPGVKNTDELCNGRGEGFLLCNYGFRTISGRWVCILQPLSPLSFGY
jgi:predicted aldo/keto reductase-like oxidoreductase